MFRKDKNKEPTDTNRQNRQNLQKHSPKMFSQSVTVNVTVNEKDDDDVAHCLSGCFKTCFGAAKKAAT
jgi:hypothetical protein